MYMYLHSYFIVEIRDSYVLCIISALCVHFKDRGGGGLGAEFKLNDTDLDKIKAL